MHYRVEVFRDDIETGEREQIFSTGITFVCLDDQGKKKGLP